MKIKFKETWYLRWVLYFLFGCVGILNMFYPTIFSGFEQVQAAPVDTRLNHYFLEHSFQWVSNEYYTETLWAPPFFYPFDNALALSDNLLGTAPIYWLYRVFSTPVTSFQLWQMTIAVLTFAASLYMLRSLRISVLLSLAGAYFFSFGIPRIGQIGHVQLLCQCFAPLALISLWRFLCSPATYRLALTMLFAVLQIVAGIYLGWFLLLGLSIFTAVVWVCDAKLRRKIVVFGKTHMVGWLSVILIGGVVLFLFLLPYLRMKANLGGGWGYDVVESFIVPLKAWLWPNSSSWMHMLWAESLQIPVLKESPHSAGVLGWLLIGACVLALISVRFHSQDRKFIVYAMLTSVLLVLFSLQWPGNVSIWKYIYAWVPGAKAIRAVNRIWTVVYLFFLPAALLSIQAVLQNRHVRVRTIASICLLILVIFENIHAHIPSFDVTPYIEREQAITECIQDSEVAYITADPAMNGAEELLTAMWAGLKANTPVVNGTSGNFPAEYPDNPLTMTTHQVLSWIGNEPVSNLCMLYPESYLVQDSYLERDLSDDMSPVVQNGFKKYSVALPLSEVYGQRFLPIDAPTSMSVSATTYVTMAICNTSSFIWMNQWPDLVQASYRWCRLDGSMLDLNPLRTPLSFPLYPYEWVVVNLRVEVPSEPGVFLLRPTMVWEGKAWFENKGAAMGVMLICVEEP